MVYRNGIKRLCDFFFGLIILLIFSPVLLVITVLLFGVNNGKPFFFQKRPGKNGRIFRIIKFKTMNDKRDAEGNLLSDDKRLSSMGKLVRKSSLDEIPQLINVVKGDMSLVGPRPLLVEYLSIYNKRQHRRHEVRPGITGWAQVNGRNTISWEQKFEYDVWYIENQSFSLDMKILWMTFNKVFKSEGISSSTSVTMEKFTGNSK